MLANSRLALWLALPFAVAACGGAASDSSAETDLSAAKLVVHGTISAQSFVNDAVSDRVPQVAWSFNGAAGDTVAFDVWPTRPAGNSALVPVLKLLGPSVSGKRAVVASGSPRGADDRHQAVDGFKLPRTGNYLVLVSEASTGQAGAFTLRAWSSASHAPRAEAAQLDLTLRSSSQMKQLIASHDAAGGHAAPSWTDADVDEGISDVLSSSDPIVAFSDAEQLLVTLAQGKVDGSATDAQVARARNACAALVGTPSSFAAATRQQQAFALYWLGMLSNAIFDVREVTAPRPVATTIDTLVASWPSAAEKADDRHVRELSFGGKVYGYLADWSAQQLDKSGTAVFVWYSSDWFDASGAWLGQQSAGASEPDDD